MKKLIIAIIAFTGLSVAGIAQAVPAKKADPKIKVVTKTAPTKYKIVAVNKPVPAIKTNAAAPLKKDGTPDKRFKAVTVIAAGPLKKDGTPDMRYQANKKH